MVSITKVELHIFLRIYEDVSILEYNINTVTSWEAI